MTCICAMVDGDEVVIGGDSAGVSNWDLETRADSKVFVNGAYIIGYTSSPRMGQLLRYRMQPRLGFPLLAGFDPLEWMATGFIDDVRKTLSEGGWEKKEHERAEGGVFLVGFQGRIFAVDSDYQVRESRDLFNAVGSGSSYALGVMEVTNANVIKRPVEEIVRMALCVSEKFCAGVRGPFTVLRGGRKTR
jgi:ATP-dependent protease HslVU (ClpYQ) peptidase subunit